VILLTKNIKYKEHKKAIMSNIHTVKMHFSLRFKDKNRWIDHDDNDDNAERSSDGNSEWPWNSIYNFSELC